MCRYIHCGYSLLRSWNETTNTYLTSTQIVLDLSFHQGREKQKCMHDNGSYSMFVVTHSNLIFHLRLSFFLLSGFKKVEEKG